MSDPIVIQQAMERAEADIWIWRDQFSPRTSRKISHRMNGFLPKKPTKTETKSAFAKSRTLGNVSTTMQLKRQTSFFWTGEHLQEESTHAKKLMWRGKVIEDMHNPNTITKWHTQRVPEGERKWNPACPLCVCSWVRTQGAGNP